MPVPKGYKHTDEAKAKISAALKGHTVSDEVKEKIRIAKTGSKASEEAKLNMSKSRLGNLNQKNFPRDEEYRKKMSKSSTGKIISEATKSKMSKSAKPWLNNKYGRVRWYEVEMPNGSVQKVQGSYELRYALYLLSQGIDFVTQPRPGLKYTDQFGGTRYYNPDFWVPSLNSYVEIKSTYTLSLRGARKKLEMVKKAGYPLIILTEVEMIEAGIDMKAKLQ